MTPRQVVHLISLLGREFIRRDPDRCENWGHVNLMKFSKGMYKFLHLGWRDLQCQYRLVVDV